VKYLNQNIPIDHVSLPINCPVSNGLMILIFDKCCNAFIVALVKHIVL